MLNLKRIVVPTDFSEFGEKALRYGCEFAERFDCELHLLHVVEVSPVMYSGGAAYPPANEAEFVDHATQELARFPGESWASKLKVTREVRLGHPFVEIVRYARDTKADLIVVGTHGRTGIAHLLIGSVAERVVRKSSCPVLVVHDPEREFVRP